MYEEIKHLIDTQQYTRVREIMGDMNPVDTASLIENFPEEEQVKVFRLAFTPTTRPTCWTRCRQTWSNGCWPIRLRRQGGTSIIFSSTRMIPREAS